MSKLQFIWSGLVFLTVTSCATFHSGEVIKGIDQPLLDIQKAVESRLPMGKRMISPNAREYFSNYFKIVDGRIESGDHSPERFYAQVYVLGDQRPYNVEVVVYRERRLPQGNNLSPQFEEIGRDRALAKMIARKIQQSLSKRREDRNVIDDFRVF